MSARDRDEFDAVVIGSGFGGAVAAQRLAEQGVGTCSCSSAGCRTRRARSAHPVGDARWRLGSGHGTVTGCSSCSKFSHVTAVISSGLGGGSLVYANVMLRKPPETFGADQANGWREWPISYAQLEEGYAAVEARLKPTGMPYDSYAVPKTDAFKAALGDMGLRPSQAPIAVTFAAGDGEQPQPGIPLLDGAGDVDTNNLHHRSRRSARYAVTVTSAATRAPRTRSITTSKPSSSRTRRDARRSARAARRSTSPGRSRTGLRGPLPPTRGGAREGSAARRGRAAQERSRTARQLRRRAADRAREGRDPCGRDIRVDAPPARQPLPPAAPQRAAGRGFSSNGDLLKFAFNCRRDGEWRDMAPSRGPVITAYAEAAGEGHQAWLEDGGYPAGWR